jgi:hypothetical protein
MKYRAFLSYAHADAVWARWLHARLEGFIINKDLVGRDTVYGTVPKALRLSRSRGFFRRPAA